MHNRGSQRNVENSTVTIAFNQERNDLDVEWTIDSVQRDQIEGFIAVSIP